MELVDNKTHKNKELAMTVENRILSLKKKHADLEDKIAELEAAPSADDLAIRDLKKEKLAIKEELASLEAA